VNKKQQKNFVNLGHGRCRRQRPWPSGAKSFCAAFFKKRLLSLGNIRNKITPTSWRAAAMRAETVAALEAARPQAEIDGRYLHGFRLRQFIWRLSDDPDHGYVAASDSRRDGHAAAF
jgi:hypothetical protein